jgi:hypothetical protein
MIVFPSALLSLSTNNGSFSYTAIDSTQYSLLVNVTSKNQTILVQNLTNMGFIPNNETMASLPNILVYTIDQENNIVAYNEI